jgi:hypothetical protein
MTASRNRRLLIIGVLGALFALGGGWLAYLAIASPGTSNASSGTAGGGSTGLVSPGGGTNGGTGTPPDGSAGAGGDAAPPKPRGRVPTTGIDLNGSGGEKCVTIIRIDTEVPLQVTSVQVSGRGVAADPGGCPPGNENRCAGARLTNGDSCSVGIRLAGGAPLDPFNVPATVRLNGTATCTDAKAAPCDQAAGRSPSAANPVGIAWTGTLGTHVDLSESDGDDSAPGDDRSPPDGQDGPDTQDGPDAPDGQDAPDTGDTPDSQSVPESGS